MATCRRAVLGIAACAVILPAARSETLDDIPAPLRSKVECMTRVLRTTPDVQDVTVGVKSGTNVLTTDAEAASPHILLHPYLDYTASDGKGAHYRVRFWGDRYPDANGERYTFWAALPGLFTPGGEEPSDWGTDALADAWHARCDVNAITHS